MRSTGRLWAIALGFALWGGSCHALDLTPKAFISTSLGLLTNDGTQGEFPFTLGGVNVTVAIYPLPVLNVYGGYSFNFDLSSGTLPLSGFYGGSRYYFWGQGTRVKLGSPSASMSSTTRSPLSFYAGLEVSQRSYFINNPPAQPNTAGTTGTSSTPSGTGQSSSNTTSGLSGSSFAFNGTLGGELAITEHFDINAEFNSTILTFAATDNRYRIAGALLRIGVGLLF